MPYATVCLGLLYSLSVVAIQFVWGVSTIKLGRLYSLSGAICTGRMGCGNLELLYSLILSIQYIVQFSALSTSVQFAYTNYSAIFIIYVIHTLFRSIIKSKTIQLVSVYFILFLIGKDIIKIIKVKRKRNK